MTDKEKPDYSKRAFSIIEKDATQLRNDFALWCDETMYRTLAFQCLSQAEVYAKLAIDSRQRKLENESQSTVAETTIS